MSTDKITNKSMETAMNLVREKVPLEEAVALQVTMVEGLSEVIDKLIELGITVEQLPAFSKFIRDFTEISDRLQGLSK